VNHRQLRVLLLWWNVVVVSGRLPFPVHGKTKKSTREDTRPCEYAALPFDAPCRHSNQNDLERQPTLQTLVNPVALCILLITIATLRYRWSADQFYRVLLKRRMFGVHRKKFHHILCSKRR